MKKIHPLNDVNRGQSTNDVYPTALHVQQSRTSTRVMNVQNCRKRYKRKWHTVRSENWEGPDYGCSGNHAGENLAHTHRQLPETGGGSL